MSQKFKSITEHEEDAAKSVSRLLCDAQKLHCMDVTVSFKVRNDEDFLFKVVAGGKSLVHEYDPETKQQSFHRKHPFLASKNMPVVPHHNYSPDLDPVIFFLSPNIKITLKGWGLYTAEDIQAESQVMLNTLTKMDFQDAFQSWQQHWDHCTHFLGDCSEGDGGVKD